MERYYVKIKGTTGANVAHDTLAEAYIEARRLFELVEQSRRVYVLQVIGTLEPTEKEPMSKARVRSRITAAE